MQLSQKLLLISIFGLSLLFIFKSVYASGIFDTYNEFNLGDLEGQSFYDSSDGSNVFDVVDTAICSDDQCITVVQDNKVEFKQVATTATTSGSLLFNIKILELDQDLSQVILGLGSATTSPISEQIALRELTSTTFSPYDRTDIVLSTNVDYVIRYNWNTNYDEWIVNDEIYKTGSGGNTFDVIGFYTQNMSANDIVIEEILWIDYWYRDQSYSYGDNEISWFHPQQDYNFSYINDDWTFYYKLDPDDVGNNGNVIYVQYYDPDGRGYVDYDYIYPATTTSLWVLETERDLIPSGVYHANATMYKIQDDDWIGLAQTPVIDFYVTGSASSTYPDYGVVGFFESTTTKDQDANWVSNFIQESVRHIFPIGTAEQMYYAFRDSRDYKRKYNDGQFTLNSLLHEDYQIQSTSTLISSTWLEEYPVWTETIYPWLERLIYIITFLYFSFRLLTLGRTYNKVIDRMTPNRLTIGGKTKQVKGFTHSDIND